MAQELLYFIVGLLYNVPDGLVRFPQLVIVGVILISVFDELCEQQGVFADSLHWFYQIRSQFSLQNPFFSEARDVVLELGVAYVQKSEDLVRLTILKAVGVIGLF